MNRRDIELLSSYLDGQLKPSDSARLETRLSADPGLRAVLDDLRAARGLLRQLPMRKAPRNFMLTPRMVGKNPPLPRAYPAFRFVTALASLLLFFTVGLNFLAPRTASQSPAPVIGGGGAPEILASEAPAMPEAAAEVPATEAPAEEPAIQMVPLPTATAAAADSARELLTPAGEEGLTGNLAKQDQAQAPGEVDRPVPPVWQIVLAVIALLGAFAMLVMRRLAADRWRRRLE